MDDQLYAAVGTAQDAFLNRSATHNLIIDCRGTPRRFASLSKS